jgi:multiple sugar transport system substrate-binding protein
MRSTFLRFSVWMVILSVVLAACGGEAGQTDEPEGSGPASTDDSTGEVVEIRWFCCLGAGDDPAQVEVEQAVADAFNESQDGIHVELEVIEYEQAYDALNLQINSPNPPDVVGPAGITGQTAFAGQWLDLQPLIDETGYDLSQFDPQLVEFYRSEEFGLEGLPFAVFPSMLYYQRDMFEEAGLEEPPHAYGDPYVLDGEEMEWNFDTLRLLALRLTVDENGNDATSPDFDPEAIVQWGYEPQYQDLRAMGSYWGAGSLVADDGTTAQVPEQWGDAWKWFYEGVWTDHFIMNEAQQQDPTIGATGNPFQSGNVAMGLSHLWYTCCVSATDEDGNFVEEPNWDVAVVPSNDGEVTANFNADTFRILAASNHPEEAFTFLTYLLGDASEQLLQLYGGLPGRPEDQETFFAGLDERFPQGVDWQVARDGLDPELLDDPSFEGYVPNYPEAFTAIQAKLTELRSTDGLDMDAEIAAFTEELQGIFDRAE